MSKFTVTVDKREQKPLYWNETDYCEGYVLKSIPVGDYSLVGYEDILAIERKGCTSEWASNVNEARFERELEKLSKYKYGFIICEFGMDDILNFPINSGIPARLIEKIKITPEFLLKRTIEIQMKYNIKTIFAGNKTNAWRVVTSIFKRVVAQEKR